MQKTKASHIFMNPIKLTILPQILSLKSGNANLAIRAIARSSPTNSFPTAMDAFNAGPGGGAIIIVPHCIFALLVVLTAG